MLGGGTSCPILEIEQSTCNSHSIGLLQPVFIADSENVALITDRPCRLTVTTVLNVTIPETACIHMFDAFVRLRTELILVIGHYSRLEHRGMKT